MGSKDNAARQRKLERKAQKAKDRDRRASEVARKRDLKVRERKAESLAAVCSSEAIGTPVLYRSLRFETFPTVGEDFDLKGTDLCLEWHATQAARTVRSEAEPITLLHIMSCSEVGFRNSGAEAIWNAACSDARRFLCRGELSEYVDPLGEYGRWLRLQEHQGDIAEGVEFSAIELEFTVSIGTPSRQVAEEINRRQGHVFPVQIVPGVLNMFGICLSGDTDQRMTGLQVDRWFEFANMLRLWVPRLAWGKIPGRFAPEMLRYRLSQAEEAERAVAAELATASELSRKTKEMLDKLRVRVQAAVQNRTQLAHEAEAALREAQRGLRHRESELSRLQGVERQAMQRVFQAAPTRDNAPQQFEKLQQAATTAKSAVAQAATAVEKARQGLTSAENKFSRINANARSDEIAERLRLTEAEEAFRAAASAEYPISKRWDLRFYDRETVLADFWTIE